MDKLKKTISSLTTKCKVGYITDIEGNYEFFLNSLKISNTIYFKDDRLEIRSNSIFVFGGDLFDKGPGDIRICQLLLDLKRRYWDRCFLIIGNRDANKLRLLSEFSDKRPTSALPSIPAVGCKIKPIEFLQKHKMEDTDVNKLRWTLKHTLGSPDAFEFRREELAILTKSNKDKISDQDVLQSYLDSVDPKSSNPFVLNYLKLGQLALRINDTAIVHGAITNDSIQFVPKHDKLRYFGYDTGTAVISEVSQVPGEYISSRKIENWFEELNKFKDLAIIDYEANPLWHKKDGYFRRGGEALMAYQSTPATLGTGVVVPTFYSSSKEREGLPVKPTEFTGNQLSYFKENGIKYILVGHKPIGISPLILPSTQVNLCNGKDTNIHNVTVVMADTTFADIKKKNVLGHTRGCACSEIELQFNKANTTLVIHGILPSEKKYDFAIDLDKNLVGRVTRTDYWVTALLPDDSYLLSRVTGRKLENLILSQEELIKILLE